MSSDPATVEVQVLVSSDSPIISSTYKLIAGDPKVGQFLPIGHDLFFSARKDAAGRHLDFRKIYYGVVKLTNKEGLTRIKVTPPIIFKPPANLKIKHKLVLPVDSPGRDVVSPVQFLPSFAGRPQQLTMNVSVKHGDMQVNQETFLCF